MDFGDTRVREQVWGNVYPEPNSGCWLWGGHINHDGYGRGLPEPNGRLVFAHRIMWEAIHGTIPEKYELDHLCKVRSCCNPAHLEAVTHYENVLRGDSFSSRNAKMTECIRGHPYVEGSYYKIVNKASRTRNGRLCKACHKLNQARYAVRKGKYYPPAWQKYLDEFGLED